MEDHLGQPGTVTKIDEEYAAVVAYAFYPPDEGDCRVGVGFSELVTGMGTFHCWKILEARQQGKTRRAWQRQKYVSSGEKIRTCNFAGHLWFTCLMKNYRNLALSLLAAFIFTPAFAGDNDTASYYRAHFEDYAGKTVSLDVAFIRVLPVDVGEGFFAFVISTYDDKNNSRGGSIVVVASADKKDAIISRYGTTVEREARHVPDTTKLSGTLESVAKGNNSYTPYVDMTDGEFEPNGAFGKIVAGAAMGRGPKGGKRP